MSEALKALKVGNLAQALQALQQEVRQHPADAKRRIFLFQLLAVMGQWDRALTQLDVVRDMDANAMPMVHAYREAVRCERLRDEVFAGQSAPVIFGDPEPWIAQLLEALRLSAKSDHEGAQHYRNLAFEAAPGVAGSIDGQRFEWLADADPHLGPVLEFISNGSYYWLPMHRIRRLRIEAPSDLRDSVWMPAGLTLVNGGEMVGFIPTRYAGTLATANDMFLLARRSDWVEQASGLAVCIGQRMFATDEGEYPLMDVREIVFDHGMENLTTHEPSNGAELETESSVDD